jgi:mono/diheme cytochrome c family protein
VFLNSRTTSIAILSAAWLALASTTSTGVDAAGDPQARNQPAAGSAAPSQAMLDQYCITCHNDRLKTAGLTLENVSLSNIPAGAAVWEKVTRKLRAGAMPPAGRPQPDKQAVTAFVSSVEAVLDREGAARPRPGRTEAIHRLNRAEYQNAVRDLLALEIDVAALLPADDMSYGFDNIAGVLKITPSLLDRYLAAARQISRVAIGDVTLPPTAETFRLRADLSQDVSFHNLPLGTRGGTSIKYHFPVDGEYVIAVETIAGGSDGHELEVSVDGERIRVIPVGARRAAGLSAYDEAEAGPIVRTKITAGPKTVGVTFVKRSSALAETLREPFLAPQAEGGTRLQPSVGSVTITGPFNPTGPGDTPARQRIFSCRPANPSGRTADAAADKCARQILSSLARRAYRRPVTNAEVDTLVGFFKSGRDESGFDRGIEMALRRLLVSPEFLFRVELDPPGNTVGAPYRISDLSLASRLSFFLWSSIPDDELLDVAVKGTLKQPAVLERQVRRMLADPRAAALGQNFAGQWLQLRTIEGSVPDVYLFPNFGENLRRDFRTETELFFQSLLTENRSVLDLLTADYTFVNERLAKHYGMPNVYGGHFRRVTIADPNRRGLLGQGSMLTVTSLADRTTVVGRGKWILDNLIGMPPAPPPDNIPPLPEQKTAGRELTLRERMERHRANPTCASCHARMDPLGFALENFDATGQWRTREGSVPVDASAVLPDGSTFSGPSGLRAHLVGRKDEIVRTTAEKLLVYALGRGLESYDGPAVRAIVRNAAKTNYTFQSLVAGIAASTPFQMRETSQP